MSTTGEKERPLGPFAHVWITSAGTAFRQASLAAPGACVQFTALAIASKVEKLGIGDTETAAPDSMIPARNGVFVECLWIACATDSAPALWPYKWM